MRVGIIGTGLIGASIGLAARALGDDVAGYDIDAAAAQAAVERGALDRIEARDALYSSCDVVVISAHLKATVDEIAWARSTALRPELLLLDIASVKSSVCEAAQGLAQFVPTHPMAGGERHGPAAAREDLFAGRTWCYVPTAEAAHTHAARSFIERLGARPVAVGAEEHDRIVALTSHLPQLFAYAFSQNIAEFAGGDPAAVEALCGPVARELLRIGRSSPLMWDEIFAANAPAIEDARRRIEERMHARRFSG